MQQDAQDLLRPIAQIAQDIPNSDCGFILSRSTEGAFGSCFEDIFSIQNRSWRCQRSLTGQNSSLRFDQISEIQMVLLLGFTRL